MIDIPELQRILTELHGKRVLHATGDPTTELIRTILSQNTSDGNTARSWARLHGAFPSWDAIVDAPTEEIVDAISIGGLANTKAPRVQQVLRDIHDQLGSYDLDLLRQMTVPDARVWLTSLPGVGPKTASCVLLFALGMPAMPVDTHVHRVSLRVGLVPPGTSPERTALVLEAEIGNDPRDHYSLHMGMIRHGRRICRARRPSCPDCPLRNACDYFASTR